MSIVAKVEFEDYRTSAFAALDLIGVGSVLPGNRLIIIKPNLTNCSSRSATPNLRNVAGSS